MNESFLERNFDNAYGALYKPDGTGSDLKWIDDNIDSYQGLNLKSESSNDDIILDMLNELNNGSDYEKYMNFDAALRYFAVSTVLANMDSYQGSKMHNYYLYEDNGIFSILPWDFNMSFAGFSMGVSKQQLIEMMIDEPTEGAVAERPLVAKLLANDAYRATYHEYVQQVIDYLNPDDFEARVNELAALIGPSVEKDPTKFYTYEQFQQSLTQDVQNIVGLIPFTASRVENVQKQLDGTLPSSGTGAGMGSTGMDGGRPGGQGGMNGQGQDRPNAQAVQNADGAAQGNAQGQAGMPGVPGAMDGQGGFPGGMNGQGAPGGMNGQGGPGGMGGGGFGGGGPGGMPGMGSTASQSQGSVQKAVETGVTVVILLLPACSSLCSAGSSFSRKAADNNKGRFSSIPWQLHAVRYQIKHLSSLLGQVFHLESAPPTSFCSLTGLMHSHG
ncbi:CotH kinase family protein [Paenibacillus sp. y28]|uniref:CotH kinase family protein n=1 Tax=Paenibacillus sp. y28 TaxID=3129110 RepID=UPI00301B4235